MKYPPTLLDEIKARLPASTVVGRRVRLTKAGREWKGLSPFNAEKTPSFYVNDAKQRWFDFSAGKDGDIFNFLMETEGLAFPEAVERLAAEAGVILPKSTPEMEVREERRKGLQDVVEMAAKFFEGQLASTSGAAARGYLDKRMIAAETRREFRFGYAPEGRENLIRHLRDQGIGDDLMIRAGLVIQPDDGRGIYDRFRDRLIIPIQDRRGRVVAFGGRALSADATPKYLNSPESELFTKGEMVFNEHRARPAAFKSGSAIVVEGYLDAIAVWQAGIPAVVASLGTAFTEEQIATLWRLSPEPVICFDGDRAGRAAAYRAVDRIVPALKTGFSYKFAFLPNGQDPDDLIRSQGADAFRDIVDKALSFWDVLWAREVERADLSNPNGQAVFVKRIDELVAGITDDNLKRRYQLTARLQVSDFLWRQTRQRVAGKFAKGEKPGARLPAPALNDDAPLSSLERIFLGICVHHPDLVLDHAEAVSQLNLRGSYEGLAFNDFRRGLMDVLLQNESEQTPHFFYNLIDERFFAGLDFLHGRADRANDLPWGHNLFARMRILQYSLPEDFVRKCFQNFIDIFWLRDREDERADLLANLPQDIDEDMESELLTLQRSILDMRDHALATEQQLAEEATAYSSPGGRRFTVTLARRGSAEMEAGVALTPEDA
jgi:DNA primase